jgi:hypothetical protein
MLSAYSRAVAVPALFALTASLANAKPPEEIFGAYSRQSRTCGGGPGFADSRSKPSCNSFYEDKLEISPAIEPLGDTTPPSDAVHVSFSLRFNYSDYCAFSGYAIWSKPKVVLHRTTTGTPLPRGCRLEIGFLGGTARLSDPDHRCNALCNIPRKLHRIAYRKETAAK